MTGAGTDGEDAVTSDDDPRADLRFETVPGLVLDAAERFADESAIIDGDVTLSFAELATAALDVTRAAMGAGLAPGERVGIWAPNSARWVVAALGLLGAGVTLVPLNTRLKGPEAADVLRRARARALCTVRGFLGIDYPQLLTGEDLPALDRIVLLAGDGGDEVDTGDQQVPVYGWDEALTGADGVVVAPGDRVGTPVPASVAEARWRAVAPDDVSDIIFTSGTTGRPKGVPATHAQTLRAFGTWSAIVGLQRGDRYLVVNPFFHTFGFKAGVLASLMQGATILPEAVLDVAAVLRSIARHRVTVLPGPPTLYQMLLDHPGRAGTDCSSLRLAVTGAAVVPVTLVRGMVEELGFGTVLTAYGLTESTGVVTMCRRGDPLQTVATTSGRAIPGVEVWVAGPDGAEVPRGEVGEILVRGYTVMAGYFEDPEATAEVIDAAGWLHTGDVGVMDAAGNVTITDRTKDMFIVGGFNAYPAEIEQELLRHPGVSQVAVVGMPDTRLGEVGCAFVVPRAGRDVDALPEALIAFARQQLANYKVPRRVVVVETLPVNAAGKVLKTELRRRAVETGG